MEEKKDLKLEAAKEIYDLKTWLNIHITQLNYLRNLIILLATAEVGYIIHDSTSGIQLTCPEKCLIYASLIINLLSIGSGLLLAILEAKNFRLKRKISRILVRSKSLDEAKKQYSQIEQRCTEIESFNKVTFVLQLALFFIATIFLSVIVF